MIIIFSALNEPDFSVSRNPTDIWSGFGLSRSVPANVWKMEKDEIKKIEEKKVAEDLFPELFGDSTPCHDLPSLLTKYGFVNTWIVLLVLSIRIFIH